MLIRFYWCFVVFSYFFCFFFFFFFSSRRRHTRSTRDWSSDVCSSDLPALWRNFPFLVPATACAKTENCAKVRGNSPLRAAFVDQKRREAERARREIGRASCRERV